MSHPSPGAFLPEGETASPPRWRGLVYDLRIAKLACDGFVSTGKSSSAASEAAASRSPSPSVPPSESSNYYAASTSSWATSAGPGTEYGFPDDETERCGNPWDDESPRTPFDREPTPASRMARYASRFPPRSPSRQSSLRNAVSVCGDSEADTTGFYGREADREMSDSECETAKRSDDEIETDKEDNEWSGQNGNLESVVIAAVDGDLGLAAHLIPLLHRDLILGLKSKIESWQCTAAQSSDGSPDGSGDKTSYIDTSPDQSPDISRKRRRTNSDGQGRKAAGGWDGDDEEEEDDNKGSGPPGSGGEPQRMLACPFHKRDSAKYGIQHVNTGNGKKQHKYRACMGPGFKSIQRLKEHLKRVHSPVQCERCHEIFPGTDRAACLARLAEHRKMASSCELGDPTKKEGIDEAQWAALDKQNRKKNQETHRVEKWFEIWDVLFPDVPRPKSPWHDVTVPNLFPAASSSQDAEHFANLFLNIMDHKVKQGDIDLSDQKNIRDGVKSVAQLTYKMYVSLHGRLAPETPLSETRNQLSLTGGSSTQLSDPVTTASHPMSATTAGTSIASHGSPAARPPPYTLSTSFLRMPQPRQYMTASPMARVPSGTEMAPPIQPAPLQASGMPAFGAMNPGDPSGTFYFPSYPMFSTPQGSWAPANPVGFPTGHMAGMAQDFTMAGANFFGDQNFGAGPAESG
ncbi:hypothetical protein QBC47DRAFT_384864 [Echria macrotheca]|uniref:C2H2-type domain-containing protein n=1 Tax=Echria macrotheca TaxID=438768 RepID=A0AAJ0BCI9_9PEZI|nr:hypothetical protein QBC47DRAFT_384864 [Echria macrotheca]